MAHVRDRVANMFLPEAVTMRVTNPWIGRVVNESPIAAGDTERAVEGKEVLYSKRPIDRVIDLTGGNLPRNASSTSNLNSRPARSGRNTGGTNTNRNSAFNSIVNTWTRWGARISHTSQGSVRLHR